MPIFYNDQEHYISAEELFNDMDETEKQEMYELLVDYFSVVELKSIDQSEYDGAIDNLKKRYYAVSKQDEQTILNISKKY